jgi:hypothetical protein
MGWSSANDVVASQDSSDERAIAEFDSGPTTTADIAIGIRDASKSSAIPVVAVNRSLVPLC